MERRGFLRLLALGVIGHHLDVDRLLWVPGQKTIFLPTIYRLTESQIVALELERILPHIRTLFERDDIFYRILSKKEPVMISSCSMKIPLIIKPGGNNEPD